MNKHIDIADRLDIIADDTQGISDILSVLREYEELQGGTAQHLLLLQRCVERLGQDIQEISNLLVVGNSPD